MRITKARVIALLFGLMALGSWTPVIWMWLAGIAWDAPAGRAVSVWYGFPALIGTLFVQGPVMKQPIMEPLGIRFSVNRWWLVAWLLPVLVLFLSLLIAYLAGFEPVLTVEELIERQRSLLTETEVEGFDERLQEEKPPGPLALILMALPAGLTFGLLIAFSSEIAFRGFFFREVPGGFWSRATVIGVLWWAWLAPSIALGRLYGVQAAWSLGIALPWHIVASWVLVYLRVRTNSVIATSLTMGTMLTLTAPARDLTLGTPAWFQPFYGVAGLCGLVIVWGMLWLHDRRRSEGRLT